MIVHCSKGCTWRQSGNRTGHCSGCHRTFDGLSAFDRHQRIDEGRVTCLDPATVEGDVFECRLRGGVSYWGLRVDEEAAAALRRMWTERRGAAEMTAEDRSPVLVDGHALSGASTGRLDGEAL